MIEGRFEQETNRLFFEIGLVTVQIDGQEFNIPVVAGDEIPEIIIGMEWLITKRLVVNLPAGILTLG